MDAPSLTQPATEAARAAAVVAEPPAGPPDSFVLHAALELGARFDLARHVHPTGRAAARERIVEVGEAYGALDRIAAPSDLPPSPDAADQLHRCIQAGDVDGADAAMVALAATTDGPALSAALAPAFGPRLSGAGHGVIALDRLRRAASDDPVGAAGLRLQAREAAAHPDWVLTWHRSLPSTPSPPRSAPTLVEALLAPPAPGPRGNGFIYPMLHLVESSGLAAEALTEPLAAVVDVAAAGRDLLRVAAWSMVQDDPAAAPYGWSHCLTLPLAVLGLAGRGLAPNDALALAATYVLSFRATQGEVRLDPAWQPPAPRPGLGADLCTAAAAHPDAHLVKYTEACLRAAAWDPGAADLYLAAAAHLADWWATNDAPAA